MAMPIIMGVDSPQYTQSELDAFREENAQGVTWEGRHMTGYEATQYQNRIERGIRTQKHRVLMSEAAGDEEQLLHDRVKLTRLNQEYARFNKAMGFKSRAERLEVIGWGREQARRASGQAAGYYKEWRNVPGFRSPETLAGYYELRYNKPDEWSKLRRSRNTLDKIDKKTWPLEFKEKAAKTFNEFLDHGVEISDHGVARFLDRSRGKKKKTAYSLDDIVAQMQKPINYTQSDGRLVRFYEQRAFITDKNDVIITIVDRDTPKADWKEGEG